MSAFDIKALGEVVFESEAPTRGDVAVVIPLYNYQAFVLDCLGSVVDQTLERVSVVVVDDGSADDGPKLAADFLRRHASRFCAARIVHHRRNQGLSMARNSGVAWSDEPLLFMLDADNRIRPPALARLKSAIEIDEADFSYSQLFMFGDRPGVGMADVWHVDRLRYGNTIDAMAMIRRAALVRAGGYAVLANDHGWEDYDLWCRFFTLGMRGVFVPELLCEYRRHRQSMTDTRARKNLDTLNAEMALRHPEIFNSEAAICAVDQDFSLAIPLDYEVEQRREAPSAAVVIHMFYPELAEEILGYVRNIPFPVDIFISTDSMDKKIVIESALQGLKDRTEIRIVPPRGLDIAPRLIGFRDVYRNHEYVLLLHSKKSGHTAELRDWRGHFLQNLLGSPKIVDSIFEIFGQLPEVGIIAAQHFEAVRPRLSWGGNFDICKALAARFGVALKANGYLDFPSGSMFWARSAALRPFFDAGIELDEFEPDSVSRKMDCSLAHAIERLVFVAAEKAGFAWIKVAYPELFERRDTIRHVSSPAELREFVARQRRILPGSGSDGLGAAASCPV